MAIEKTPRLGLSKYTSGSDLHPNRTEFNALQDLMETLTAISVQGTLAQRPAAGTRNRIYWATDTNRLYFDDGTQWLDVNPNGGGGAGTNVLVAGTASEGASARAARADHTHNLPLATSSAHGAMNKADKAKLDAATGAATPLTLPMRNESGQIMVGGPTASAHAATKGYVDAQAAKKSDLAHKHAGEDITSGTIDPARIANATSTQDGLMSKGDRALISSATASAQGGMLVKRNDNGHISVATPELATHPTTKKYVDDLAAERLAFKGDVGTANLNTVLERGQYWCSDAANAVPANNYPIDSGAGTLVVLPFSGGTGYVVQEWTERASTRRFLRSTADKGVNWTGWKEQATTATATKTANGLMSAADKTKLDGGSSAINAPGALVQRADTGFFQVPDPTADTHPASKKYTDAQIKTRAAASHTHSLANVTTINLGTTENLDAITDQGFYIQGANANAVPELNYPVKTAGHLKVTCNDNKSFVWQTYQAYGTGLLHWRARYSNVWSAWQSTSPTGHKHNGADITTGTIDPARIANATSALDGLMPKADKAKLDAAAMTATAGTIAMRDTNGNLNAATPTATGHVATKGYVDTEVGKRALSSHKHAVGDLTAGNLSMTHLRLSSTTDLSETSTGHALQIGPDTGINLAIDNNEIAVRNNGVWEPLSVPSGVWGLPAPTTGTTATNKDYVDGLLAGKSATTHKHSGADITSGTVPVARLPLVTQSANGIMLAADKTKLDTATSVGTASTLMVRDTAGRARVANPSNAADIANKSYVDTAKSAAISSSLATITARGAKTYVSNTFSEPANSGTLAKFTLCTIQVPDPGWPYHILVYGNVEASAGGTATRWDVHAQINGTTVSTCIDINSSWFTFQGQTNGAGNGAGSTVTLIAAKVGSGTTNFGLSSYNRWLNVLVIPAA